MFGSFGTNIRKVCPKQLFSVGVFYTNIFSGGLGGLLGDDMGLGKTIQVISFLSAIMRKHGDVRDRDRRRNHVSELQDDRAYRKKRLLPPANATWPTCLIIAVSLFLNTRLLYVKAKMHSHLPLLVTGRENLRL